MFSNAIIGRIPLCFGILNLQYIVFMKRRAFLYNAAMGTLGFTYLSGFPIRLTRSRFTASLDSFFLAIGAKPQSRSASDAMLEEVCTLASTPWKQTGYKPLTDEFYICKQAQKAVYLLHLSHKDLGTLDVAALIFQKEDISRGNWKFLASLSGVQLEALTKAAEALSTTHTPSRLANLLLPDSRPAQRVHGRFTTALGEVAVKAILSKDKNLRVEAAVYEANQRLWSSEYSSQYLQSL